MFLFAVGQLTNASFRILLTLSPLVSAVEVVGVSVWLLKLEKPSEQAAEACEYPDTSYARFQSSTTPVKMNLPPELMRIALLGII